MKCPSAHPRPAPLWALGGQLGPGGRLALIGPWPRRVPSLKPPLALLPRSTPRATWKPWPTGRGSERTAGGKPRARSLRTARPPRRASGSGSRQVGPAQLAARRAVPAAPSPLCSPRPGRSRDPDGQEDQAGALQPHGAAEQPHPRGQGQRQAVERGPPVPQGRPGEPLPRAPSAVSGARHHGRPALRTCPAAVLPLQAPNSPLEPRPRHQPPLPPRQAASVSRALRLGGVLWVTCSGTCCVWRTWLQCPRVPVLWPVWGALPRGWATAPGGRPRRASPPARLGPCLRVRLWPQQAAVQRGSEEHLGTCCVSAPCSSQEPPVRGVPTAHSAPVGLVTWRVAVSEWQGVLGRCPVLVGAGCPWVTSSIAPKQTCPGLPVGAVLGLLVWLLLGCCDGQPQARWPRQRGCCQGAQPRGHRGHQG